LLVHEVHKTLVLAFQELFFKEDKNTKNTKLQLFF